MKDNKIQKLDFSDEFLMESAERRFESGDYLGALTMLNKRAGMYDPSADASALYADIYESLGLFPQCADAWFRFLDTCNEADFAEGYEGLSVAFINMGDELQSEFYYRRAYSLSEDLVDPEELTEPEEKPNLRIVHSSDGSIGDLELLQKGILYLRSGELDRAGEIFSEIPPESIDYPSAAGLSALCHLLNGDAEGAARECRSLLKQCPDNVSALTTYCAVLGAKGDREGAREIGRRIAELPVETVEENFRAAVALCETGLDKEAYDRLVSLKEKLPYSEDLLWFLAVSAYKTGRREESIAALELLTTVYPRKAVAKYYLIRLRSEEEGEIITSYFYRMPEDEYKTIGAFFLAANAAKPGEAEMLADLPEIDDYFRIAFDQLDGRDGKLQALAAKVAVKIRCDSILREVLLDYMASEGLKISILRDLTMRNEENSFGVVVCNLYREFFTHEINLGSKKRKQFLTAFAEVYSKYALLGEENEEKLVEAAEEVYDVLESADALDFAEETDALSAVIYRQARMHGEERSLEKVCELFDANARVVKDILNYII